MVPQPELPSLQPRVENYLGERAEVLFRLPAEDRERAIAKMGAYKAMFMRKGVKHCALRAALELLASGPEDAKRDVRILFKASDYGDEGPPESLTLSLQDRELEVEDMRFPVFFPRDPVKAASVLVQLAQFAAPCGPDRVARLHKVKTHVAVKVLEAMEATKALYLTFMKMLDERVGTVARPFAPVARSRKGLTIKLLCGDRSHVLTCEATGRLQMELPLQRNQRGEEYAELVAEDPSHVELLKEVHEVSIEKVLEAMFRVHCRFVDKGYPYRRGFGEKGLIGDHIEQLFAMGHLWPGGAGAAETKEVAMKSIGDYEKGPTFAEQQMSYTWKVTVTAQLVGVSQDYQVPRTSTMSQLYEQVKGFCGTRGSELELCCLGRDEPLPLEGLISDHFISEGSELFARFRVLAGGGRAARRVRERRPRSGTPRPRQGRTGSSRRRWKSGTLLGDRRPSHSPPPSKPAFERLAAWNATAPQPGEENLLHDEYLLDETRVSSVRTDYITPQETENPVGGI